MKRLSLALAAVALGAGAVYFLDPRQGLQRRRQVAQRARSWVDALGEAASHQMATLGGWVEGVQQRMGGAASLHDEDGLEPLSMTPPPLEQEPSRRSRMLPALAVAGPVAAVAVGAALLRHRDEEGQWLH